MSEAALYEPEPLPRGAQEGFLLLSGLGFFALAGFIFAYGLFGAQWTAGLDEACAEASFLAGQRAEEQGNMEAALTLYRQAMAGRFNKESRRYECGRAIGDLLLRQERYAEAIEAYRALPAESFTRAGAYTGFVSALLRARQFPEAERLGLEWRARAEAEGDTQQVQWADGSLMRIYNGMSNDEKALEYAERVAVHSPGTGARLIMARILDRQGKKDEAIALVEQFRAETQDTKLRDEAARLLQFIRAGISDE